MPTSQKPRRRSAYAGALSDAYTSAYAEINPDLFFEQCTGEHPIDGPPRPTFVNFAEGARSAKITVWKTRVMFGRAAPVPTGR